MHSVCVCGVYALHTMFTQNMYIKFCMAIVLRLQDHIPANVQVTIEKKMSQGRRNGKYR